MEIPASTLEHLLEFLAERRHEDEVEENEQDLRVQHLMNDRLAMSLASKH